jgi:hypothetical protein
MATFTGTLPIKRAIVRRARTSGALNAALVGGIHQRLAPRKIAYPFMVYDEVDAPFTRDWGSSDGPMREIRALFDITIYASNPVEAENLGQLVDALYNDAETAMDALVDGQRVFYCTVESVRPDNGPERDDTGAYYAQHGLTLGIWTVQVGT